MIGSSKNSRENCPKKCFLTRERGTRVKFYPGLSASRLSNNWALGGWEEKEGVLGREGVRNSHFVNFVLSTGDLRTEGGRYYKTLPLPLRERQF